MYYVHCHAKNSFIICLNIKLYSINTEGEDRGRKVTKKAQSLQKRRCSQKFRKNCAIILCYLVISLFCGRGLSASELAAALPKIFEQCSHRLQLLPFMSRISGTQYVQMACACVLAGTPHNCMLRGLHSVRRVQAGVQSSPGYSPVR